MSESFEQLLQEEPLKSIHTGEVVEGTVIAVKEDEIALNIGYKVDGIIKRNEYTNDTDLDLTTVVKVGDVMQAKVKSLNDGEGQVVLSYKKIASDLGNKKLEEAFKNHEVITAKVSSVLNSGICCIVDEARVFIPASLVSDVFVKDLSKYANQEVSFVIVECDLSQRKSRIIGDCKQLIVAEKAKKQAEVLEKLSVGAVVKGCVKNITDFGAFIDLGGIDGLLHISEMSWGRIESPKKHFKVGDEVTVFIKAIEGEKIALSMKFEDQNPWADAATKFAKGNVVKGKVARMADFGAFVEIEAGIDALLHVSQISKEHIEKPSDVLSIGQEIEAKIVDANLDEKKISLSIKALLADAEDTQEVTE